MVVQLPLRRKLGFAALEETRDRPHTDEVASCEVVTQPGSLQREIPRYSHKTDKSFLFALLCTVAFLVALCSSHSD